MPALVSLYAKKYIKAIQAAKCYSKRATALHLCSLYATLLSSQYMAEKPPCGRLLITGLSTGSGAANSDKLSSESTKKQ